MADFEFSQSLFDNGIVPLIVQPFDFAVDPTRGTLQPIRGDGDGALLVRAVGAGLTLFQTVDLTSVDYTPAAGELAEFSAAINWGYDPDNAEYRRINMLRETIGFASAELEALHTANANHLYIGTEGRWQEARGNDQRTQLTSAARTASTQGTTRQNVNHRGAHFIIDVTAVTGAASITPTIETQDETSTNFYPLLTGPAINAVGTTILKIGPGFTPIPNLTANDNLPFLYRINVAHATGDSITYSVGVNLLL